MPSSASAQLQCIPETLAPNPRDWPITRGGSPSPQAPGQAPLPLRDGSDRSLGGAGRMRVPLPPVNGPQA